MSIPRRARHFTLSALVLAPAGLGALMVFANCDDGGGGGAGSTSTSTGSSLTTTSSSSSGTGGGGVCDAPSATTAAIHDGTFVEGAKVHLEGVTAMSQKFLRRRGNDGSCVWAFFVSSPNISVTTERSGILVESLGDPAEPGDAGPAFCKPLGLEPTGGAIPDDVAPGDVVDIRGVVSASAPTGCAGDTTITHSVLVDASCPIVKSGVAGIPQAHLLSPTEVAKLSDPLEGSFHDEWEGVKIAMSNEAPVLVPGGTQVDMQYGVFRLVNGGVGVDSRIYYRGYLTTQPCHDGAAWATSPGFSFLHVEGFSQRVGCEWLVEPNDKCGDISPPSDDCSGQTCPGG